MGLISALIPLPFKPRALAVEVAIHEPHFVVAFCLAYRSIMRATLVAPILHTLDSSILRTTNGFPIYLSVYDDAITPAR